MKDKIKKHWLIIIIFVIIAVAWFITDFQKKERQFEMCVKHCLEIYKPFESFLPAEETANYNVCVLKCREIYGK